MAGTYTFTSTKPKAQVSLADAPDQRKVELAPVVICRARDGSVTLKRRNEAL